RATVTVSLDCVEVAVPLSELGERRGQPIPVYMEVDTGLRRLGVPPASAEAVALARALADLPGIRLTGVMTHGGHMARATGPEQLRRMALEQAQQLVETARLLRRSGFPVEHVSPGSTLGAPFEVQVEGVTEIRPGTYAFYDAHSVAR